MLGTHSFLKSLALAEQLPLEIPLRETVMKDIGAYSAIDPNKLLHQYTDKEQDFCCHNNFLFLHEQTQRLYFLFF